MNQSEPGTLYVEDLIDAQGFGWFNLGVLVLLFITTFADGYDVQAASFAAPSLVGTFGVSRAALTPMLTASLVGVLFGAPGFGWFGDRFGRKRGTILALASFGLFSLACAVATGLTQLTVLRFGAGLGIGGLLPNVIALSAELSPRRLRGLLTTLMFIGITVGGAVPGLVAATLVPDHGWPVLFVVGGVGPLLIAGLLAVALPESPLFLATRPEHADRLRRVVARIDRRLAADPRRITVRERHEAGSADLIGLVSGRFSVVSPLLWSLFAAALLTIYLLTSWLPVILESGGLSVRDAALMISNFQLGGSLGGLMVSLLLDRFGLKLVVALFVLAGLSVLVVALQELSPAALSLAMGVAGFCILGLQFGLNTSAGMIYPTALRSKGIGWALGVGRLGSVLGPTIGGVLMAFGLASTRHIFLVPVVPLALGAIASLVLIRVRIEKAALVYTD